MTSYATRHIWIIRLPTSTKKSPAVLYERKYPTVEKRARCLLGKDYVPLPPTSELMPLLIQKIDQTHTTSQFIPARDRCDLPLQRPVYKISTEQGVLWPIVALEKSGLMYCCLPLVEETVTLEDNTAVNTPSVALGFALICTIAEFFRVTKQEIPSKVAELTAFLNEAAPFGLLRDCTVENICARLANKPCVVSKNHKLPAWKAASHKGKNFLHLHVSECIMASQCAKETWQDQLLVYGTVSCKAEFENPTTDITLNLSHHGDGFNIALDSLTVHPCVHRADWQELEDTNPTDNRPTPRRMRFSPPSGSITLCHYTVRKLVELPIFGVYHMKQIDDTKANVTVQLKLNDQIKNNFDYCELRIPFYTRSPVSHAEGTPTQGTISVSQNKKEVVWNIGQKFIGKDQQALLAATVTFSSPEQGLPAPSVEDAFCRGKNSYAQLYFKIQEFTHSGCCVDPKAVQISPATKFKLQLGRDYVGVDYKIWNSAGEALTVLEPDLV